MKKEIPLCLGSLSALAKFGRKVVSMFSKFGQIFLDLSILNFPYFSSVVEPESNSSADCWQIISDSIFSLVLDG